MLNHRFIKSVCLRGLLGLLCKTQDEVWDFFKKLVRDTYEFEWARASLRYLTHGEYASYVNPDH